MQTTITIDKASLNKIAELGNKLRAGIKQGLIDSMFWAEAEAKKSFGREGNLKSRTGRLRASIRSGLINDSTGFVGTDVIYGPIHETGGVIRPVRSNWLRFQIDGQWKTVKQVIIPPRPFIGPAVENNINKIGTILLDRTKKSMEE